jgi:3,4-dihydroxy-2-butanone 4-phosphate synthase
MLRKIKFINKVAQREPGTVMLLAASPASALVRSGDAEFCEDDETVLQSKQILPKAVEVIKPKKASKK